MVVQRKMTNWCWKGNQGGTTTSFSESGGNLVIEQVNTTAGFSILDYVGTGSQEQ